MIAKILIARLNRFRSLQALGFPSSRSEPHHMWHIRPLALGSGRIEPISPDILRSTGRDMLCQLPQETGHREGFDRTGAIIWQGSYSKKVPWYRLDLPPVLTHITEKLVDKYLKAEKEILVQ